MLTLAQLREAGWGDRAEEFHAWLSLCNRHMIRLSGLSMDDLPDQPYADAFEAGESPLDIAREVLLEEGLDV